MVNYFWVSDIGANSNPSCRDISGVEDFSIPFSG